MAKPIQKIKVEAFSEAAFMSAMKRLRSQGYEIKLAAFIHKTAKDDCPLKVINPPLVTVTMNRIDTCPICKSKACICSAPERM